MFSSKLWRFSFKNKPNASAQPITSSDQERTRSTHESAFASLPRNNAKPRPILRTAKNEHQSEVGREKRSISWPQPIVDDVKKNSRSSQCKSRKAKEFDDSALTKNASALAHDLALVHEKQIEGSKALHVAKQEAYRHKFHPDAQIQNKKVVALEKTINKDNAIFAADALERHASNNSWMLLELKKEVEFLRALVEQDTETVHLYSDDRISLARTKSLPRELTNLGLADSNRRTTSLHCSPKRRQELASLADELNLEKASLYNDKVLAQDRLGFAVAKREKLTKRSRDAREKNQDYELDAYPKLKKSLEDRLFDAIREENSANEALDAVNKALDDVDRRAVSAVTRLDP